MKSRIALALPGHEIQKIPLGHESNEFAVGGQMREVRDRYVEVVDLRADLRQLLMGTSQELVQNAELVHKLERRGMDGVAAEITQEILVLFENCYFDSSPGEQETQHHPRRSSARDTAPDLHAPIVQSPLDYVPANKR